MIGIPFFKSVSESTFGALPAGHVAPRRNGCMLAARLAQSEFFRLPHPAGVVLDLNGSTLRPTPLQRSLHE